MGANNIHQQFFNQTTDWEAASKDNNANSDSEDDNFNGQYTIDNWYQDDCYDYGHDHRKASDHDNNCRYIYHTGTINNLHHSYSLNWKIAKEYQKTTALDKANYDHYRKGDSYTWNKDNFNEQDILNQKSDLSNT